MWSMPVVVLRVLLRLSVESHRVPTAAQASPRTLAYAHTPPKFTVTDAGSTR